MIPNRRASGKSQGSPASAPAIFVRRLLGKKSFQCNSSRAQGPSKARSCRNRSVYKQQNLLRPRVILRWPLPERVLGAAVLDYLDLQSWYSWDLVVNAKHCCSTIKLRHAGPTSQDDTTSANRRCLERLVRRSVTKTHHVKVETEYDRHHRRATGNRNSARRMARPIRRNAPTVRA